MELFLGVDGGQSTTSALIGDTCGRVLGAGASGPCNHVGATEGPAKLSRAVSESVEAACRSSGLDPLDVRFRAACFGMSGGPHDKESILRRALRTDLLEVTDDSVVALAGALAGEPGLIVIAGTGAIAFGRNARGESARAGGWGYIFGDEAGAFGIVRQALRAMLRSKEGWGPRTALTSTLLAATGAPDANALLHWFYTADWPRSRVAKLAALVNEAAEKGDDIAIAILHDAAAQLATLAAAVRAQLWNAAEPVSAAYVGGVFQSRMLLERYCSLIETNSNVRCAAPVFGPAAGALIEAYRLAGIHPVLTNVPALK